MKHSEEKIIEALTVIQEVCKEHRVCNDCPFNYEFGNCSFDTLCPTDIDPNLIKRNMQEG